MPYIDKIGRLELDDGTRYPETAGELNYVLTSLVHRFLGEEPCYDSFNAAIGVLECAKLELYRRKVAAYEDEKILENGDV